MQPNRYFAARTQAPQARPSMAASAEADQGHAGEVPGLQPLAQHRAPSRMAVTGIRNVTSSRLVAPAAARMRKYRT